MDYNWPLFDGAHVLIRPKGMTIDQLQEGYYSFLRQAYSSTGILRRFRGRAYDVPGAVAHFVRNWMVSRYGMIKTAHAIRRKGAAPVGMEAAVERVAAERAPVEPVVAARAPVSRKRPAVTSSRVKRATPVAGLRPFIAPRAPEA